MRVERIEDGIFEKRLSARERDVPEARARLASEAALLARLAGVVTPRLVATGDDARGPFLRTERIPFPTLAERLEAGAVDAAWLERAARAAFRALATLHDAADDRGALAIVHADLSPANVAIDDAATRAVFLDLELACWREAPPRSDGAFRGTVFYCAPEIARGEAPRPASDLFALAASLLHAAIGRPPRATEAPSLAALIGLAAETPILDATPELTSVAARGPGHAAILDCLAHEPEARPASAREVAARLQEC
ncbi:MAG: phosphotransferase [Deltaproteobacteria bacterium]|nr:phosphotransferase [Deltaproteobacteria bacterium]